MSIPTTIEATLVTKINTSEHLTSLIGNGADARIYPGEVPQGVKSSAIVFTRISAPRSSSMRVDDGWVQGRFQFTCWGRISEEPFISLNDALALSEGLRKTLQRYMDDAGTYGVPIADIYLANQTQTKDDATESQGMINDYIVWFKED